MSNQERITITDVDKEYRKMCFEIAQSLNKDNVLNISTSRHRRLNTKHYVGDIVKLAIEELYGNVCK